MRAGFVSYFSDFLNFRCLLPSILICYVCTISIQIYSAVPPAIQKSLKVISITRAQRIHAIYPYSTYGIPTLPAVPRIEHQLPILQYFVWKTVQKALPSIWFDYHILYSKSLFLPVFTKNYRKLYNSQGIIKTRLFIRKINIITTVDLSSRWFYPIYFEQ